MRAPLSPATTIRRAPDVVSRVVAGEAVIVDLRSGLYYGLDPVGTRAWELVEEAGTYGSIVRAMLEEFDVEGERLEADLDRLFGELSERQLVTLGDGAA